MANPMKVVKAAKRLVVGSNKDIKTNKGINKKLEKMLNTSAISQGKAKAIERAKKSGIDVSTNKSGKLKLSEYTYFGNPVSSTGGKNSKRFAKLNQANNRQSGAEVGVSAGRNPAVKSRGLGSKAKLKARFVTVIDSPRIPVKNPSKQSSKPISRKIRTTFLTKKPKGK